MPIKKTAAGYKWGGKTYKTKAGAQRQMRAAHAAGYKKKRRK